MLVIITVGVFIKEKKRNTIKKASWICKKINRERTASIN
jgi:hypothetical protein